MIVAFHCVVSMLPWWHSLDKDDKGNMLNFSDGSISFHTNLVHLSKYTYTYYSLIQRIVEAPSLGYCRILVGYHYYDSHCNTDIESHVKMKTDKQNNVIVMPKKVWEPRAFQPKRCVGRQCIATPMQITLSHSELHFLKSKSKQQRW